MAEESEKKIREARFKALHEPFVLARNQPVDTAHVPTLEHIAMSLWRIANSLEERNELERSRFQFEQHGKKSS